MASKDASATCSVCQQRNTFRQLPQNVVESGREDARLFCNTCNTITLQKLSNVVTAGSQASNLRRSGQQGTNPELSDDMMWGRFERAVTDSQMRLADVFRCDEPTRRAVVERLGFRPEAERLLQLIRERHPQNLIPVTPVPSQPSPVPANQIQSPTPASSQSAVRPPQQPQPAMPHAGFNAPMARSAGGNLDASPLRGITFLNDAIIARCSVYPDLAAEFWCCTCNVLVSSRCHVVGVHKDHPFITLRVAAEGHVRDLSAWTERCRSQLGITESIIANLHHSANLVQQTRQSQIDQLEKHVASIIEDIMRWKDQLKQDIHSHVDTQVSTVQFAAQQAQNLHDLYSGHLRTCEPLLSMVPAPDISDKTSEEWSLRTLDFVSKLKLLNIEPVPLPKIFVPEIKSVCTPATPLELIKQVAVPLGVRLPDLIDPGYFNFPHPTSASRVPFTLQPPVDAKAKGVLIYSGRTLTRAQDVLPSQTLVAASQVFYSGTTTWEVHVDRLGAGPGRILAGIVIQGSDGEGIVWDGQRIVGPNEGECRTIDDRFVLRPGTVLRFVLELDPPQHFLSCFFDRDGVARIPLPPTGSGWVPAFSVFGPQDQITVVPTSSTNRLANVSQQFQQAAAKKEDQQAVSKIKEQEQLIAALQQQLQSLTMRVDAEQFRATVLESNQLRMNPLPTSTTQHAPSSSSIAQHLNASGGISPPPSAVARPMSGFGSPMPSQAPQPAPVTPMLSATTGYYPPQGASSQRLSSNTPQSALAAAPASTPPAQSSAAAVDGGYSSELQSLLRFVGEIR